jgi:hypothetical protein
LDLKADSSRFAAQVDAEVVVLRLFAYAGLMDNLAPLESSPRLRVERGNIRVELDASSCRSVYLADGLGHAFVALTDDTVTSYLCSTPSKPSGERGISPLAAELGLPWRSDVEPVLPEMESQEPTLAQAVADEIRPRWDACQWWYKALWTQAVTAGEKPWTGPCGSRQAVTLKDLAASIT